MVPRSAEGKLVFIDNTVTPQTGTVLLKTRVANRKEAHLGLGSS